MLLSNLPPAADRGKSGSTHVLTIPGPVGDSPGKYTLPAVGSCFSVVASPARLRVRLDSGSAVDMRSGASLDAAGVAFERVEIENTSPAEIVVVVYVGFASYRIDTSETIDAFSEAVGDPITEPLAAHSTRIISGGTTGKYRARRSAIITNLSPELDLEVCDLSGRSLTTIFPRQAYRLDLSGSFMLRNTQGAPIPCTVGGVWYTELAR